MIILERVENDKARAFLFRMWNTVKGPLVVIATGVVIKIVSDISEAQTASILANWSYWDGILVTVAQILAGLLGVGALAGTDKVLRTE